MPDPVEFALATSSPVPSTGGATQAFFLVLQNLAPHKQVAIRANMRRGWHDLPARYVKQLPDRRELWMASTTEPVAEFAASYTAGAATYRDDAAGANYRLRGVAGQLSVLAGHHCMVVLGAARLEGPILAVNIGVQNLAPEKSVGIVYSTDHWATVRSAQAAYSWTMGSGLEVWKLTVDVGVATPVQLAVFYRVGGQEFWDNNFWQDYCVVPGRTVQWAEI